MNKAEIIYSVTEESGEARDNVIPFIAYHTPAPKRCLDMLLAKYYGEKFCSEVKMPVPEKHVTPVLSVPLAAARIMMVTDGGLVPTACRRPTRGSSTPMVSVLQSDSKPKNTKCLIRATITATSTKTRTACSRWISCGR